MLIGLDVMNVWQNEEKQTQHYDMKWLNRFIWFTDIYIFYQPPEGASQFGSTIISFDFSDTFHVALKIKITSVFCINIRNRVLYTQFLYDKKQHILKKSLQWLLTYNYSIQWTYTPKGLVLNQLNFGKVKRNSWPIWPEPTFLLMISDNMSTLPVNMKWQRLWSWC